jgi:hypothetical protein
MTAEPIIPIADLPIDRIVSRPQPLHIAIDPVDLEEERYDSSVVRTAAALGLATITWEVDPGDYTLPGAAAIRRRVLAQVRPGSIVLSRRRRPARTDAGSLPGHHPGVARAAIAS